MGDGAGGDRSAACVGRLPPRHTPHSTPLSLTRHPRAHIAVFCVGNSVRAEGLALGASQPVSKKRRRSPLPGMGFYEVT